MSFTIGYAHFSSIMAVLAIAGVIHSSSLTPVMAAPEISLSSSSGHVGDTIRVQGTGFSTLSSIEILFNGEPVSTDPEDVRAGLLGSFDAEFDVPQSEAGNAVVTARERISGNAGTAEFEVINDAPVAEDSAASTDEGTSVAIELAAADANGDSLVFTIVQNPEHGALTEPDESGTVTYAPNTDYNGEDEFTFQVSDGLEDSNTAKVSINIAAVNDPPVTEDQEVTVEENGEVSVTLTGSDPEGEDLVFSITEDPVSGVLTGEAPDLVYTPSPGFSGNDGFTYVANDGESDSNASRVSITVSPVNDAPSAAGTSVETDEDESVTVALVASDPDSDSLTFTITSQPSHGALGEITPLDSTSATVEYTPTPNYSGTDSFTFRASDGTANSNEATVDVTINPVNDSPEAIDQSLDAPAGRTIEITLTASDPDGDELTFSIVEGPQKGTLGPVERASDTSATVSYRPDSDQSGSDSFTFRATDDSEDSDIATVSIDITASSGSGSSGNNSQSGDTSGDATSGGTENSSTSDSDTGGANDGSIPDEDAPPQGNVDIERAVADEIPIQDTEVTADGQDSANAATQENEGLPGQAAAQSLAASTVESNPFMRGPAAWLLSGAIAGVVSVVALLGYRKRQLKKDHATLQPNQTSSAIQPQGVGNILRDPTTPHKLQERITHIVGMNKIYRILDNESGILARERVLGVEYRKSPADRKEFENSVSVVKNQFEEIGSMLRSNPALKSPFFESFADLTIKVWWAIKQDVNMDRRRGRHWDSLEWLGSEAEKYWSARSRSSSQAL